MQDKKKLREIKSLQELGITLTACSKYPSGTSIGSITKDTLYHIYFTVRVLATLTKLFQTHTSTTTHYYNNSETSLNKNGRGFLPKPTS